MKPRGDQGIAAIMPRGKGVQFVFYGDSCSGIKNGRHEETHAAVNRIVSGIEPPPEFIVFPGDEIIGLVSREAELRKQWAYWIETEMAWHDRARVPMFHTTGNHTVFDTNSARVFHDVMRRHLPLSSPDELSYVVRRGDVLLVFLDTLCARLGGEGHVDLAWLENALQDHRDAQWKFVVGHHPAFPVNGYVGRYLRTIGPEYVDGLWGLLTDHGVIAYLCSHILAFDVQVHTGVLQITSAGAGTAHRMPEGVEYLHCVQIAVDEEGLRFQVLDETGQRREKLAWPPDLSESTVIPADTHWNPQDGATACLLHVRATVDAGHAARATIASGSEPGASESTLWVGLAGPERRLLVLLQPIPGRSPHAWFGPALANEGRIDFELMLHPDLGPGGILWRPSRERPWTSLEGYSAWGIDRVPHAVHWHVGRAPNGDLPFQGGGLDVQFAVTPLDPVVAGGASSSTAATGGDDGT